ncbi:hypothetical protein ACMA5K_01420 [Bradyrhizobium diazoefficiens]|uniref:hypothetical protein n=1 Tax=Bradyrhizobium diazoefficiens TaxID=1355477 RepID=UPI000BE7BB65|nr:hypothetical protein [Bradyrhizobium diazoefficiens]PDT62576.1 hypothetical protein CO678_09060 [Bradyrhizobium diazoefficiens]QLD39778.1 hypothetical protein HUW42_01410 [Bradyrhizobium diazoefficiens]
MNINAKTYDPYEWMKRMADPDTDACMRDLMRDNLRASAATQSLTDADKRRLAADAEERERRERRLHETNNGLGWGAFRDASLTLAEWWAQERPGEEYVPHIAADARREDKAQRSADAQRQRNQINRLPLNGEAKR